MQGLRIIKDNEKLTLQGDGWKWFYKRLPSSVHKRIVNRHTNKKGVTDWHSVGRDIIVWATLGWEGFLNGDEPIAFTPENLELVVDALPQTVAAQMIEAANDEAAEELGAGLKNSPSTHDSNPTTTD